MGRRLQILASVFSQLHNMKSSLLLTLNVQQISPKVTGPRFISEYLQKSIFNVLVSPEWNLKEDPLCQVLTPQLVCGSPGCKLPVCCLIIQWGLVTVCFLIIDPDFALSFSVGSHGQLLLSLRFHAFIPPLTRHPCIVALYISLSSLPPSSVSLLLSPQQRLFIWIK